MSCIQFPSLTSKPSLPFLSPNDLILPLGSPNSYPSTIDGKNAILHSETGLFLQKQIVVSYTHHDYSNNMDLPDQAGLLPSTKSRIQSGRELDCFIFGDSISTGCNASKFMNMPPYNDAYPQIISKELQNISPDSKIRLINESEGGQNSRWGKKRIKELLKKYPEFGFHLNIIAWGANDAGGKVKPRDYYQNIAYQMKAIKKKNPEAEFILVCPLLPNPIWIHANHEFIWGYAAELEKKALNLKMEVAVANVTKIWAEIIKKKSIYDIIGNGINHPNDFGHQIYAQVILNGLLNQV
jgi:hypothetical protein